METPKPGDKIFDRVLNVLIGSADTSASAADTYLRDAHQFELINVFSNKLDGEAREYGSRLIGSFRPLTESIIVCDF
jgi:glycerate-2-kinase